ncbi:DNA gyrase subunit B [Striga asiatica]|uniref:DNA gyrase subunit B n=1 Tax=Striga asiatica TaxID=4170 RepID=A0A5A7Q3V4_STRAF|nr:DNA gyrase subunit B [Striga asiatica]
MKGTCSLVAYVVAVSRSQLICHSDDSFHTNWKAFNVCMSRTDTTGPPSRLSLKTPVTIPPIELPSSRLREKSFLTCPMRRLGLSMFMLFVCNNSGHMSMLTVVDSTDLVRMPLYWFQL